MRTTLDIDDDILAAARELARAEKKTVGQMISELARKALTAPDRSGMAEEGQSGLADWPTLPRRGGIVTSEQVRKIQDEIDAEESIPWDFETNKPRVFDDPAPAAGNPARRKSNKTP